MPLIVRAIADLSIVERLRRRAAAEPGRTAFTFLDAGGAEVEALRGPGWMRGRGRWPPVSRKPARRGNGDPGPTRLHLDGGGGRGRRARPLPSTRCRPLRSGERASEVPAACREGGEIRPPLLFSVPGPKSSRLSRESPSPSRNASGPDPGKTGASPAGSPSPRILTEARRSFPAALEPFPARQRRIPRRAGIFRSDKILFPRAAEFSGAAAEKADAAPENYVGARKRPGRRGRGRRLGHRTPGARQGGSARGKARSCRVALLALSGRMEKDRFILPETRQRRGHDVA